MISKRNSKYSHITDHRAGQAQSVTAAAQLQRGEYICKIPRRAAVSN